MPTMITVTYRRIPTEPQYHAAIRIDSVPLAAEEQGKELGTVELTSAPLEEVAARLHEVLQAFPSAQVTMIQEPTRPLVNQAPMKGYELAPDMVEIIRSDIEKAKEMFSPITRTVKVGRNVGPSTQLATLADLEGEDHAG